MKALAFLILLFAAEISCCELAPEEIAVVCNIDAPESLSIAHFYAQTRSLPEDNIIQLSLGADAGKSISRKKYISDVKTPVKAALSDISGIRCLVTVYGVPYKIRPWDTAEKNKPYLEKLQKLRKRLEAEIQDVLSELSDAALSDSKPFLMAVNSFLYKELEDAARKDRAFQLEFMNKVRPLYGSRLSRKMAREEFGIKFYSPNIQSAFSDSEIYEQLSPKHSSYSEKLRRGYYETAERLYGKLEAYKACRDDIEQIKGIKTQAALDSELSMLNFRSYRIHGSAENEFFQNIQALDNQNAKTLMVCRLDGPGETIIKRIISNSAQRMYYPGEKCVFDLQNAEKAGLADAYVQYDSYIEKAAEIFRKHGCSTLIEETASLTDSNAECMFYAGWYSPGNYNCRLNFIPGSIAYHITSFGASELRSRKSRTWCPNLLKNGADAVIGSAAEPVLTAMPRPELFAGALLDGKTLVEAFYYSKPQNSWTVLLVGDPLMKLSY
ncbi:hypothetical protein L21SP3_01404 [Sedimentisphaera cyanobacteriorum]|uniref:TIGR03790 family protein n=1 Tax=Sedimentisphaera cyanobacteriorum TaxID=1940790 RepID=A0A1Q2HQQ7_9BACT|nr:TIGR03790 family protein [Sedimentisphaera cyanobacteriorum]AQQ09596.1 hypothetical protein L21SP3_01404 [Sedimentisphaera cyanobacteriorum]